MIRWLWNVFFGKPASVFQPPPRSEIEAFAIDSLEKGEPVEVPIDSVATAEFPPFKMPPKHDPIYVPTGITCQANKFNCSKDATSYVASKVADERLVKSTGIRGVVALCDRHTKRAIAADTTLGIIGAVGNKHDDKLWKSECDNFSDHAMQRARWVCDNCGRKVQTIELAPHCNRCEMFLTRENAK